MEHHAHIPPPRTPLVPPGDIDLHERDMTATFSADVTLHAAQQRLATAGHWLPIDGDPDATLGQLIDQNSTGPLRLGYGAWRDLLLGVQFHNHRGELISAGGRTVKNVAGYDLTKFMVGQGGAFGQMVTLTTRTYRRPAGAIVVRMSPNPETVNLLLPSPLRPQWMLLTENALHLGYLGDERTLGFYRQQLPTLSPAAIIERTVDEDIEHRTSLWCAFGDESFRATVPPASVLSFVANAGLQEWTADPTFGIVVGRTITAGRLTAAAEAIGGKVMSAGKEPQVISDVERKLLDRLKTAFGDLTLSPDMPVKD